MLKKETKNGQEVRRTKGNYVTEAKEEGSQKEGLASALQCSRFFTGES